MTLRLRAVITAGGTAEPIDDVRVVANHSTGRFGAALARALAARGVDVTVIGSSRMMAHEDWLPPNVRRVSYRSWRDLQAALDAELATPPDVLLMAAAVSDYSPVQADGKLKSSAETLTVHMTRNPKLLTSLRDRCGAATTLVGFKLLSGVPATELVAVARRQLQGNRLDVTVANDMAELTHTHHPVWIVTADQELRVEGTRSEVADAVVDATIGRALPDSDGKLPWPAWDGPKVGRARRWWLVPDAWVHRDPTHVGHHVGADPSAAAHAWLAHRRSVPWDTIALPLSAGRVLVGMGEVDAARTAEAWQALVARAASLGPVAAWRSVWHGGQLAGLAVQGDDGVTTLLSSGLVDAAVWPAAVLYSYQTPARRWAVPTDELGTWREHGFSPTADLGDRTEVRAPWERDDTVPAASACLVHVPSRQVLVGRRLVAPARGGVAFPGGRAWTGEAPARTARRELLEETGVDAPHTPPWFTRQVWFGADPTWSIAAHVWRVALPCTPVACDELNPSWRPIDDVLADPATLPGVRLVLEELVHRLENA